MSAEQGPRQSVVRSLSARLLVLTVAFVMIAEVLIFVPSIARFRVTFLEQRIEKANLAALSLFAAPDNILSKELEQELLKQVGAVGISLKRPESRILVLSEDMPPSVDAQFDLARNHPLTLIRDAFQTLLATTPRHIRVLGPAPMGGDTTIELILPEAPLRQAMLTYSYNILTLSIIISLITAALLFLALQWLLVRPIRRITASMVAFRREPEHPGRAIRPSNRQDEIGIAERELAAMQNELRQALTQKAHLAALGVAVSKVNHDLRNILATAQLVSDRLTASADPEVRRTTPRLIDAIDRAINLCTRTLRFGRADEPPPRKARVPLADLVDEVGASIGLPADGGIQWSNRVANGLAVTADRDQLFRVLLNLGRNAVHAMKRTGEITVTTAVRDQGVAIRIGDTGPGLPPSAREHLFEAFQGSVRTGGTGLGLAIARDLARAHGGDLALLRSDLSGTVFEVYLPDDGAAPQA